MIAVESSFRPRIGAKGSSAFGLMQITNTTRKDAKNLNDGIVDLERQDLEDPVINIALTVRWISYKYESMPRRLKKNLFHTVWGYYDWEKGESYANKVFNLYRASANNRQ